MFLVKASTFKNYRTKDTSNVNFRVLKCGGAPLPALLQYNLYAIKFTHFKEHDSIIYSKFLYCVIPATIPPQYIFPSINRKKKKKDPESICSQSSLPACLLSFSINFLSWTFQVESYNINLLCLIFH